MGPRVRTHYSHQLTAALVLDHAVLAWRNDGLGATLDQPLPQRQTVIAFVGNEFGKRWLSAAAGFQNNNGGRIGYKTAENPPLFLIKAFNH